MELLHRDDVRRQGHAGRGGFPCHRGGPGGGGARGLGLQQHAVADVQHPLGVGGNFRLVGNHHNGDALLVELLENLHNLLAGFCIQGAGGLVGQQHLGVVHNGAGNGHPLALAAGELGGLKIHPVPQAHTLQGLAGNLQALLAAHPGVEQGQGHVLQGALPGEQVEALEHKANAVQAHVRKLVVAALGNILALQDVLPRGGAVQAADDIHQGGFAGAGGAHNGHVLPFVHREGDVLEHRHVHFALGVVFVDVLQL